MKSSPDLLLFSSLACLAITGCQTTAPDRFNQTDANHDGKLSHDELNTYLVTGLFESRDADHDQKMTKAEWVVGNDATQVKAFQARDTNKDGVVALDEAIAYGKTKGTSNQLVRDADKNKDGAVSREEIDAYYASKEGAPN